MINGNTKLSLSLWPSFRIAAKTDIIRFRYSSTLWQMVMVKGQRHGDKNSMKSQRNRFGEKIAKRIFGRSFLVILFLLFQFILLGVSFSSLT